MEMEMSDKSLGGKVALVTGGYRNLGAAVAEVLAQKGAQVVISGAHPPESPQAQQELARIRACGVRAEAIGADLRRSTEVRRLCRQALESLGRVDILVNNAGPFSMDPYLTLSEETWDTVIDVNLKTIYLTAQELAPQMKKNKWGRIVNVSAGSAFVRNHGVYTLAKAAVNVLTESLALELGPEITVNTVAPGQIAESVPEISKLDPAFGERYAARAPAGRLIHRGEVAEVIAELCTPAFDMVTGMTLRLDGGAEIPRF
jgi:NAD(P)-dependent dehydrogenase (short-subunit alcohol dehydrogenase family)